MGIENAVESVRSSQIHETPLKKSAEFFLFSS